MKNKQQTIDELARKAFDKMILEGYVRGLALATIKGITTKNVLQVNDKVDELLRKWRNELEE